jgi:hypothetical protein
MRSRAASRPILIILLAAAAGAGPAAAEGMRNITSVALVSYFDGSFRLESSDTFLAQIVPGFTVLARVSRNDTPGYNQHVFTLGPVVNFSKATYAELSYGLGIDSAGAFSHEAEANFNYETEATWAGVGVRAVFFPSSGYYYFLPSFSGKFHPVPSLGLFGKAFISIDKAGVVTNSFWGEADYMFSARFTANVGFTVSRAEAFGYSLIAGVKVSFSPAIALQYSLQYLSDTVTYLAAPQPRSGVSNGLVLDWKF